MGKLCRPRVPLTPAPAPRLGRRGWEPRVIWIGVGGSVFFTVLEASKKLYAPKPAAAEEPKKKK